MRGAAAALAFVCLLSALAWSELRDPVKRVPLNRPAASNASFTANALSLPPITKDRAKFKAPALPPSPEQQLRGLPAGHLIVLSQPSEGTPVWVQYSGSRAPPAGAA